MKFVFAFIASLVLSACNISAEISNLDEAPSNPTKIISSTEGTSIVSGSQSAVTASGGYKVSTSVGNWASGIKGTSSGGYQVYTNLDGQIHSE